MTRSAGGRGFELRSPCDSGRQARDKQITSGDDILNAILQFTRGMA